jgi:hypothetical protein
MIEGAKLLDRWLPPEGVGRPIGCIATSFAFEPDFFEGECLSRFLGFDGVRGETNEVAFLIEEEERLAETSVTAIVDRTQNPGNRNLRWDLIAVAPRRGFMHAKVTMLAWERLVRFVVASANLTRQAYRANLEAAVTLEAYEGSELPRPLFDELLESLRTILELAPDTPSSQVPVERADATIRRVERLLDSYSLRATPGRGAPKITVVVGGPGRPLLPQLQAGRSGPVPRSATVLSPYYDIAEDSSRVGKELAAHLARTGQRRATFVLPADQLTAATIVRAPSSIQHAMPRGVESEFRTLPSDPSGEPRRLHAKSLVLSSDEWVVAMLGSSNFTAAGYGLIPASHVEVNVAIGAAAGSKEGKALAKLIPVGDELDPEDARWEDPLDEDEDPPPAVPWGFLSCLGDPNPPVSLVVDLDPSELPTFWELRTPNDVALEDQLGWRAAAEPTTLRLPLADEQLPFWIKVRWQDRGAWFEAGLPVNVTDPEALPPPSELRTLSVELLLRVLASTRPLHEALARELERQAAVRRGDVPPELDPLKRYSGVGQLLSRARRVSAALEGMRRRLELPVASLETLRWRLFGPIGPRKIAELLVKESQESDGRVRGEPAFILAELALTLDRVEWASTLRYVDEDAGHQEVRRLLRGLADLRSEFPADARLLRYVDEAFAEVER